MKLIKDLGTRVHGTKGRKTRFGIYECPICSKHFEAQTGNVKSGGSTKCKTCSSALKSRKHGLTRHPLFNAWSAMVNRCHAPKSNVYESYGAVGVTVCDEWRADFLNFYNWSMQNGWKPGLNIDKDKLCRELGVDPMVYSPTTCLWLDNSTNTACSKKLSKANTSGYRGVTQHGKMWDSRIQHLGVVTMLGKFKDKLDAAVAYDSYVVNNKLPHTINGVIQDTRNI